MTALWVHESYENATEGHGFGESEIYETEHETPGELFRAYRGGYGRCVGKVYVDLPDSPATPVGWVFEGRSRYEDTQEEYLRRVWVVVHERPPTVTREYHYARIAGGVSK